MMKSYHTGDIGDWNRKMFDFIKYYGMIENEGFFTG